MVGRTGLPPPICVRRDGIEEDPIGEEIWTTTLSGRERLIGNPIAGALSCNTSSRPRRADGGFGFDADAVLAAAFSTRNSWTAFAVGLATFVYENVGTPMKFFSLVLCGMMTLIFAGCTNVSLVGQPVDERGNRPDILDGDCSDRVNHAVMEEAQRIVPHQFNSAHPEATDEEIDEEQRAIEKSYAWARTLPDREIRSCYVHWLGYYQYDLDACRSEAEKYREQLQWEKTHEVPISNELHTSLESHH